MNKARIEQKGKFFVILLGQEVVSKATTEGRAEIARDEINDKIEEAYVSGLEEGRDGCDEAAGYDQGYDRGYADGQSECEDCEEGESRK